jgi:hypothetical protein
MFGDIGNTFWYNQGMKILTKEDGHALEGINTYVSAVRFCVFGCARRE